MCLYDFTALLAVQDIPVINYDPEDLDRELKNIGVPYNLLISCPQ
ncbi:hypothetical protein FACS189450_04330 [Spirochaetia bacterium]|nr:hypothetical protein FACS189450_04330 [Spirochaetia bacterium]